MTIELGGSLATGKEQQGKSAGIQLKTTKKNNRCQTSGLLGNGRLIVQHRMETGDKGFIAFPLILSYY